MTYSVWVRGIPPLSQSHVSAHVCLISSDDVIVLFLCALMILWQHVYFCCMKINYTIQYMHIQYIYIYIYTYIHTYIHTYIYNIYIYTFTKLFNIHIYIYIYMYTYCIVMCFYILLYHVVTQTPAAIGPFSPQLVEFDKIMTYTMPAQPLEEHYGPGSPGFLILCWLGIGGRLIHQIYPNVVF